VTDQEGRPLDFSEGAQLSARVAGVVATCGDSEGSGPRSSLHGAVVGALRAARGGVEAP